MWDGLCECVGEGLCECVWEGLCECGSGCVCLCECVWEGLYVGLCSAGGTVSVYGRARLGEPIPFPKIISNYPKCIKSDQHEESKGSLQQGLDSSFSATVYWKSEIKAK